MRLFIAIDLPTDVKQELAETARSLGRQATSARLVPEENFHLTLVFIGESQRVDDIRRVMTEVCALHGSDPISIALEGIGSFRQKHGHTWWVGVQADPELVVLAGALAEALRQIGLAIQRREFQPHITLARGVHSSGPVLLEVPSCEFTVPGISLMRSQHKGDRMVYTELARV